MYFCIIVVSSIRVCLLLTDIYSVAESNCCAWTCFFQNRFNVCQHSLIFFQFWVLFLLSWGLYPPWYLQILVIFKILFSLSIMIFLYSYFTTFFKNHFCIRLLICSDALTTDLLAEFIYLFILEGHNFFIAWQFLCIFLFYLLSPISYDLFFLIVSSDSVRLPFIPYLFHCVLLYFNFLSSIACHSFFICSSCLVSHPWFFFISAWINFSSVISVRILFSILFIYQLLSWFYPVLDFWYFHSWYFF